jgi:RNA polymerase sigma-70 factor (ECF subfamily)
MLFRLTGRERTDKSDNDLLREFRQGNDLNVIGELYARYMHLVYGVCLKYLKDREESMDAVMQIFEKLIHEIPKHDIDNFRSWLHVVTKNYCLMELRSGKSIQKKHAEWIDDTINNMESDTYLHPVDGNDSDTDRDLQDCIDRLKEEQKQCINLFYFERKCYNEIAASLHTDEKKVKSHLQNAKRNLKLCLEEKNGRER